ncbi:GNAT family N-acetyltransferase [Shewanella cyperi]|uniref:GNAT family N-acetyltransferase n=1 Tax=Shewanella cyperi TaxID=2814292 RepID=UPI001A94ECF9|nr:GNAT family N-acetyltransferase [Shewanella cyperi]QSX40103.1 GNAT family N-acetyltransferase [Shewanella cyperi]
MQRETELKIIKATAEDTQAIWNLRVASILAGCPGHYPDDLLASWTEGQPSAGFSEVVAGHFYIACRDERSQGSQVVGSVMLDCDNPELLPGEGQLEAVFVAPSEMGRGTGRALVTFAEALARNKGLKRLRLESTLNAIDFYRRCGFGEERMASYQSPRGISLDCCIMYKNL